jgi:hypothetical protein
MLVKKHLENFLGTYNKNLLSKKAVFRKFCKIKIYIKQIEKKVMKKR